MPSKIKWVKICTKIINLGRGLLRIKAKVFVIEIVEDVEELMSRIHYLHV